MLSVPPVGYIYNSLSLCILAKDTRRRFLSNRAISWTDATYHSYRLSSVSRYPLKYMTKYLSVADEMEIEW